ncbi:hypothetical protein LTR36_004496 [Oleoguttula mirabilis]|uniref:Uncharacterized protein n=1 Tax=Oleoguttula mirabilis TaxID=1507867 RepID=A0AAV9JH68_9PEZI|nr:hypothetical protein LTR36_004496 [Oleoguttula mirabilis]
MAKRKSCQYSPEERAAHNAAQSKKQKENSSGLKVGLEGFTKEGKVRREREKSWVKRGEEGHVEKAAREKVELEGREQAERIAEEARVADEVRVAEERRLAEDALRVEAARLAEEDRVGEEDRAAEEDRLQALLDAANAADNAPNANDTCLVVRHPFSGLNPAAPPPGLYSPPPNGFAIFAAVVRNSVA